ncbi:MAG TPA: hypothetical protein VK641_08170 [Terriglobales bacterium]|jgi:hypothetical protein|nr:hypothetical protein [Terriglobales bacterium]
MNPTQSTSLGAAVAAAKQPVPAPKTEIQRPDPMAAAAAVASALQLAPFEPPKAVGYGLPCAKCKTYFAANLTACPVCKNTERVSATAVLVPAIPVSAEELPDPELLEQERERFLREFQTQVYASQLQINATTSQRCSKEENHRGSMEAATVCQGCYDHLQEHVDVLEAVLHMDVKDASQVIYDAVWADPSDPSKTYLNAAQALLGELRRRSGITQVFGPLQPLTD